MIREGFPKMANGGIERCDGPNTVVKSPVVSLKMQYDDQTIIYPGKMVLPLRVYFKNKKGVGKSSLTF
jgi:hypothetical protein